MYIFHYYIEFISINKLIFLNKLLIKLYCYIILLLYYNKNYEYFIIYK